MKPIHLFKFMDLSRFPMMFRRMQTNTLQFVATRGAGHRNLITFFMDISPSHLSTGNLLGWIYISSDGIFAYNLFTGVDERYRGRKLGQAVKVLALRYARDVLQVSTVRTHHNTFTLPMIAIDRKFGYVQMPGFYSMEKSLD